MEAESMTTPQMPDSPSARLTPVNGAALLEFLGRTANDDVAFVPNDGLLAEYQEMARPSPAMQRLDLIEEQFRFLIENAVHITAILGPDFTIRYVSPAIQRMLGYSPQTLRGRSALDLIHPEDVAMIKRRLEYRAQHPGVGEFVEFRAKHKDGSWRVLEAIASNRLDDPRISGIVVDARDITERVWTAERLQRSLDALVAIHDVGQQLAPGLEQETIARALLDAAMRVAPIDGGVILLRNARGRLHTAQTVGPSELCDLVRRSRTARSSAQQVLRTGAARAFHVAFARRDERYLNAWVCPLRVQDRILGVMEVFGEQSIEPVEAETLCTLADRTAGALDRARLYRDLAERERRLEDLVGRLFLAQEEDRRHVAYNIHDGLAQFAAAAYEHLQAFASQYHPRSRQRRDELKAALDLTARTVREARCLISGLRPPVLDDFGLSRAISSEVQGLRAAGWDIEYTDRLGLERLPQLIETALFRVVQEALANVRKHANSRRVAIQLMRCGPNVHLEVRDWGRGFRLAYVQGSARSAEHVGLAGMQERIGLLGGHCTIRSRPGAGTRITVEVPVGGTITLTTRRDRARPLARPPASDPKRLTSQ